MSLGGYGDAHGSSGANDLVSLILGLIIVVIVVGAFVLVWRKTRK